MLRAQRISQNLAIERGTVRPRLGDVTTLTLRVRSDNRLALGDAVADYEALQFIFNPLQLVSASETRIVFENSPDWNDNQTYTILEGSFTESGGAGAGFDGGAITKVIHAANDTGTTPIGEYTGDFPTFETFLASVDAIAAPYLQLADQAGWLDVEDLVGDGPSDASDTAVAFEHVSGGTVIFRGQNLNIDPTNFAGTITALELLDANGAVIQSSPLTPPMSLVDFINALEPSEAVTKALVPADHSFTSRIEQGDWLEVKGGAGDNTIIGSDGPESIEAAGGDDTITTGGGFDTIVYDLMFEPNIGHDVITDFMPGEDNITIVDPAGVSSLDDLDVTQDEDGNTIISGLPGTDGSITLEGITKNLLTSQYHDWDDGVRAFDLRPHGPPRPARQQ